MPHFPKKQLSELDPAQLHEPALSEEEWQTYLNGWDLFNAHRFWDAHESWEIVWRQRPEISRLFFQGIIQLAAAYHLIIVRQRFRGAMRNLDKAEEKLRVFPARFLGVDVRLLLSAIDAARVEMHIRGPEALGDFNVQLIPMVVALRGS